MPRPKSSVLYEVLRVTDKELAEHMQANGAGLRGRMPRVFTVTHAGTIKTWPPLDPAKHRFFIKETP
jgi:hypothetical protein